MTDTDFERYRKERYEDQIAWYDRKSQKYKKLYVYFQSLVIVLALITPVAVALEQDMVWLKWLTVVISSLVAIGTTIMKTFTYQETWISYRTTCETLRKEIHFYDWRLGEYGSARDPRQLFVDRVESLLSQENTRWLSVHKKDEDKSAPAKP